MTNLPATIDIKLYNPPTYDNAVIKVTYYLSMLRTF